MEFLSKWLNFELMKEPLNWAIVWVIASIWLLAFHSVMRGFTAMQASAGPSIGAGPGMIASGGQVNFQTSYPSSAPSAFDDLGGSIWQADQAASRWAEDGWSLG
jgi:hypothetical protein